MKRIYLLLLSALLPAVVQASEADLKIPGEIHEFGVLHWGFFVAFLGILFGLYQFLKVKKLPAHKSMLRSFTRLVRLISNNKASFLHACSYL